MKRMAAVLFLGAVSLSLVGCSSDYIMSTKNGEMIVTQGKPEIDKDTGMTRYVDQQGYSRQIKTSDVSQLIEKD
ncbi:YgdI/YgdR family lipoprotein [Pseudescherichia sp.]|uniref:YgdI/YgdR family lipoprotein n=1 Tax=Pseudescherichia sp. TaxID=2055881 RepID=UPI0028A20068|nr:YgdI/YgdR family lipoprotein [Pseudescherichia sp.]